MFKCLKIKNITEKTCQFDYQQHFFFFFWSLATDWLVSLMFLLLFEVIYLLFPPVFGVVSPAYLPPLISPRRMV